MRHWYSLLRVPSDQMYRTVRKPEQQKTIPGVEVALHALHALDIAFRGPFITPRNHRIYVVGGCILKESEIVTLHDSGSFASKSVDKSLSELKSLQTQRPRDEPQSAGEQARSMQRRSQRVMLRLDVLVRWNVQEGSPVQTHAFTVTVNAHGGLMKSPFRMTAGQRIALINPQTGKEVDSTVVSVCSSSQGYFTTAFEFDQRSAQFWAIAFPPLDWEMKKEPA
ncbi:MAG: hypothetical protein WBE13_08955 [Candidatus Acidiferrum sp.]